MTEEKMDSSLRAAPSAPQVPIEEKADKRAMAEALKPCRLCGSPAEFGEVDDMDHPDFGGHFIACTNGGCQCCVGLRYANKDDPRPLLAEQWNRVPSPSSLADDEDERGFTPSDYSHTAELLRSTNEKIRSAAASNNHNIILAALDRCTNPSHDALVAALADLENANEALAATRSLQTYLRMINFDKAESALQALDEARRNARSALANAEGNGGRDAQASTERGDSEISSSKR